jgi:peroxiredoxin
MSKAQTEPATRPGMSLRTRLSLLTPILLVAAWYGGKALVRSHVDGLIHAAVDQDLPKFSLQDRAGSTWTRESTKGKPLVLHFLRSRCGSCDVEAPDYRRFESLANELGAQVLHVFTDRVLDFPPELTEKTIANKNFKAPVLLADAAFVDAFHSAKWSNVTPVTYVADAKGTIRYALRGGQTADALVAAVRSVQGK